MRERKRECVREGGRVIERHLRNRLQLEASLDNPDRVDERDRGGPGNHRR